MSDDPREMIAGDNPRFMTPTASTGPVPFETIEQVKAFHDGFISGLTAYAGAIGHSGLKSENETLRNLMDKQGWETIEEFERVTGRQV